MLVLRVARRSDSPSRARRVRGKRDAGGLQHRRQQVEGRDQPGPVRARGDVAGPPDQQRDPDRRLVGHELLPTAVLAPHVAVVRGQDHEGVVERSAVREQLHRRGELVVGAHDGAQLALAHRLRLRRGVVHRAHVGGFVGPVGLGNSRAAPDVGRGVRRVGDREARDGAVGIVDRDPVRRLRGLVEQERRGAGQGRGEVLPAPVAQVGGGVAGHRPGDPVDPHGEVAVAAPHDG